jgi:hypothetical protein
VAKRGRPPQLEYWEQLDIAHDYYAERDTARELRGRKRRYLNSPAIIQRLAKQYSTKERVVSERMVVRCVRKHGPGIRRRNSELRWRRKFK